MDLKTREQIIKSIRGELAERPLDYEVHDSLICQLLSYSAALMEAGRLQDAHAAILDADEEAEKLAASPLWVSSVWLNRGGMPGRINVLSAACRYNMSVLFFEIDELTEGSAFLQFAVEKLDSVDAHYRGFEIYTTFKRALDQLVYDARMVGA